MTSYSCLSILSLAASLVVAPDAWAGGDSPVQYSKVDASTVRVFALGTVGVTTIDGPSTPIQIAAPHAGHGTGFAIESDLIITAQHVVSGARHIVVRRPGKAGFVPARVVYSSEAEDIAVLHVDAKLPRIRMSNSKAPLRVRQTVYTVGYPLDPTRTQAQSARGIIAGHLEDKSLQLDISLNPGNSGGPLIDEQDFVVGMVVSRGDVKRGVQGIGVAVPTTKLKLAVVQAHRKLASGNVVALSERDTASAEVVDDLFRAGTISMGEQLAITASFSKRSIDRLVDAVVRRLDDPDLLVFLAGNLWNTAIAIDTRLLATIGGERLTAEQAGALADDLRTAAIRLVGRSRELDAAINKRSRFVDLALSYERDKEDDLQIDGVVSDGEIPAQPTASPAADPRRAATVGDSPTAVNAPSRSPSVVASKASPSPSTPRWTLQGSPALRMTDIDHRSMGGELELKRKLISSSNAPVKLFGSLGVSAGLVSVANDETQASTHTFAAFEVAAGLSFALGRTTRFELYGGVAPSYYTISRDVLPTTSAMSAYVLDHYHASATLSVKWLSISAGVRWIHSTSWVEPVGLGVTF